MSGKRVICGNHGEGRWSWRRRSKRITAQATATLSEWAEPCMGMRRVELARERIACATPTEEQSGGLREVVVPDRLSFDGGGGDDIEADFFETFERGLGRFVG